jgi:hypothetical protein
VKLIIKLELGLRPIICDVYTPLLSSLGERLSVVVKALCYKPEGRGFDMLLGQFLNLPNLSGRTRPWGLLSV